MVTEKVTNMTVSLSRVVPAQEFEQFVHSIAVGLTVMNLYKVVGGYEVRTTSYCRDGSIIDRWTEVFGDEFTARAFMRDTLALNKEEG